MSDSVTMNIMHYILQNCFFLYPILKSTDIIFSISNTFYYFNGKYFTNNYNETIVDI